MFHISAHAKYKYFYVRSPQSKGSEYKVHLYFSLLTSHFVFETYLGLKNMLWVRCGLGGGGGYTVGGCSPWPKLTYMLYPIF